LSFTSFRVRRHNSFLSSYTSYFGVSQGSVLRPLLFIVYSTALSTLISSLSMSHQRYADDTQLFFSFHQPNFDTGINYLQNTLQQMLSWVTANLLTRNSPHTELLLIGLRKQLDKIKFTTSHSTPFTLLATLASSSMNTLTFLTRFLSSPNLTSIIFNCFVEYVRTLVQLTTANHRRSIQT